MKKIQAIIIDDDRKDVETLVKSLSAYGQIKVVGNYVNAMDGLVAVREQNPDVVFLDIEMPGMTGMEFMERLDDETRRRCRIVVYTAFVNYAVESFRHQALDVLLKPVDPADLYKVVFHILDDLKKTEKGKGNANDGVLEAEKHLLMFMNKTDFQVVKLNDICLFLFEEKTRKWQTYACDGNRVYSFTLKHNVTSKDILALSPSFIQVHKKHIINVDFLMMLKENECYFFPPFKSIKGVTVSVGFKKSLMERYTNF